MVFNLHNYMKLLQKFQNDDYKIYPLGVLDKPKLKNQILLRHDVDFDVSMALKMATIEAKNNIQSSYYFLLRSNSYNFFSFETLDQIQSIKKLGHNIGLHFDASIYEDVKKGLKEELKLFENISKQKQTFITIHRPSKEFTQDNINLGRIRHSYESIYFKKIDYFSDSGGAFSYGLPQDSEGYAKRKTFQFLTHPIWWTTKGKNNIKKLKAFQRDKGKELSSHIAKNCLPWKDYLSE